MSDGEGLFSRSGAWGRWCILVHGGAGNVPEDRRALHQEGCRRAARIGADVLRAGGSSLDAVEAAVRALEEDPLFNAGTGACLNADGRVELDASIMEGRDLRAGAVCALSGFRAPISIARAALNEGTHVLYAAEGAARFARAHHFAEVHGEALVTEAARKALMLVREGKAGPGWAGETVGAVARDAHGVFAAATSTGGTVNKRAGRIGDSPIIGAGTYADDEAGAVSTTGDGEGMMRLCAARAVIDRLRNGLSAEQAGREMLSELSARLSMKGGAIVLDRHGTFSVVRATPTMSWAAVMQRSSCGEDGGLGEDEASGV